MINAPAGFQQLMNGTFGVESGGVYLDDFRVFSISWAELNFFYWCSLITVCALLVVSSNCSGTKSFKGRAAL